MASLIVLYSGIFGTFQLWQKITVFETHSKRSHFHEEVRLETVLDSFEPRKRKLRILQKHQKDLRRKRLFFPKRKMSYHKMHWKKNLWREKKGKSLVGSEGEGSYRNSAFYRLLYRFLWIIGKK